VDLEEARHELGLSADATPDVVRRSYLRLLKTRKPEVDPEGFQRLRGAYELLRLAAAIGEQAVPEPSPPAPESPALDPEPLAPESPPFVPFARPIAAALAEQDLDRAHTLASETLDALLDVPSHPVFVEGSAMFAVVLELWTQRRGRDARILTKKIRAHFTQTGNEARVLQGGAAAIWAILRELTALGKGFPDELTAGFARGVLEGSPEPGYQAINRLRKTGEDLDPIRDVLRERAPSLFALYGVAMQPPIAPTRYQPKRERLFRFGYAVFIIMGLNVFRLLTPSSSNPPPQAPEIRLPNIPQVASVVDAPPSAPPEDPNVFKQPAALARGVATTATELHENAVAKSATTLALLVEGGACTAAARELATMKKALEPVPNARRVALAPPIEVLRRSLVDVCHLDPQKVP